MTDTPETKLSIAVAVAKKLGSKSRQCYLLYHGQELAGRLKENAFGL